MTIHFYNISGKVAPQRQAKAKQKETNQLIDNFLQNVRRGIIGNFGIFSFYSIS